MANDLAARKHFHALGRVPAQHVGVHALVSAEAAGYVLAVGGRRLRRLLLTALALVEKRVVAHFAAAGQGSGTR